MKPALFAMPPVGAGLQPALMPTAEKRAGFKPAPTTEYDPARHHRSSIRLQGYDYARTGAYFVTICTKDRACLFGAIVDGGMALNDDGRMAQEVWGELPGHYPHMAMDAVTVMPNHIHGIIILTAPVGAGLQPALFTTPPVGAGLQPALMPTAEKRAGFKPAPTITTTTDTANIVAGMQPGPAMDTNVKRHSLSEIIRAFKTFSASRINQRRHTPGIPAWRRNYHEHIIRDDGSLNRIREYIANNPAQWGLDRENPAAAGMVAPLPKDEPWRM
ncbi:MAG: transposase [Planctomycetota bacterium]